ncbi:uncharacterized protein BYT42DRAFT_135259 [Radiomyces spectabilis]|uniref:uncharacterized protein n=1 Tax=Radiomyces spectabilis TaxID=64574 RepID=UPI00221EC494|nr:uncharacterized protein BYT42DRAFT_135259 [Radiomyces spectabilis]KAI8367682.1 hypothetical protein BYT42DRAFT_135259 [Radiomyces spectabilis]
MITNPATASQIISEMLTASDFHVNLHNHVQFLRVTLRVRLHQGLWGPYLRYLMPLGCKAHLPAGGYFLWVKLPPRITHIQVKEQIRQHELGVNVGAGDLFFVPGVNHGDTHLTFVRLCFAHYSVDKLREAVVLLAKAIEYVIAAHDQDDAS